jgi:hypothetical protein
MYPSKTPDARAAYWLKWRERCRRATERTARVIAPSGSRKTIFAVRRKWSPWEVERMDGLGVQTDDGGKAMTDRPVKLPSDPSARICALCSWR